MNKDIKSQYNNNDESSEIVDLYPSVKDAIAKIAGKEGYTNPNIENKLISADGGNYFGILYEINIKGDTVEENEKETNLFVKQILPNGDDLKLLSITELLSKEVFVYTELAKIFTELQDNADIPTEKRFKFAKIYYESDIDAIILENMTKRGFKTYGKIEVLELNYAELCIEQLAKFHGLAFLIEKRMPNYFQSKIKSLKQSLCTGNDYKIFANKLYKVSSSKLPSQLKLKVDKWWEKALDDYLNYLKGTMTDIRCLCHGDYKTNNIMYKEIEGKVTEVIPVDYQLVHYGSPILDLIYFICMGSDRKFRKKYLGHLKDYYHDSLQKYLEYFNVLVDDVYPKKIFEKEFEDCFDFGLVSCICILPFVLNAENGNLDLIYKDIMHLGLNIHDIYYERLQEILVDFLKCDL